MWFSSKPTPPASGSETPTSEFTDSSFPPSTSGGDSESIKKGLMRQIMIESSTANAQSLMESINKNCFAKCVPKPGDSLTSSESTCVTQCMEKYMQAWNHVNAAYLRRLKQESGNGAFR